MNRAMLSLIAISAVTSACATSANLPKDLARPDLPTAIQNENERLQLFEAHKIVCVDGDCSRNGEELDLSILPAGGSYADVNTIIQDNDMLTNTLYATSLGLSAVSSVILMLGNAANSISRDSAEIDREILGNYSRAYEREMEGIKTERDFTIAAIATAGAALVTGVVALFLTVDEDEVAGAYNEGLRSKIDEIALAEDSTGAPLAALETDASLATQH